MKMLPKKILAIREKFAKTRLPGSIIFFILGIASTVWFLIRVIPKPSRAGYPCMQAAAPFMSGFIIYLLSLAGAITFYRKSKQKIFQAKYLAASLFILAAFISAATFVFNKTENLNAFTPQTTLPDGANNPMGTAEGVNPGRVVWVHDKNATNENCNNTQGNEFYKPENNNQQVVIKMMDSVIINLTGAATLETAWDSIFFYFNKKKHDNASDYSNGEIIFIKINEGTSSWLSNSALERDYSGWKSNLLAVAETTPVTTYALLDQLVNHAGVPQENIIVADPQSHVWQHTYEYCATDFPSVNYGDNDATNLAFGRTLLTKSTDNIMVFSDKGTVMSEGNLDNYYLEMETADYLINLAALKAHARAGITLTAKNHFGSQNRGGAGHMHPGLIAPENDMINYDENRDQYNQYRVQVDLMAHERLGGNTLLFLVDGLWGGPEATEAPVKWNSYPFNGDWPSSLFASLDQVALESVCLDFLRNEFDDPDAPGKARPLFPAVDDYLHQAADPANWPVGITYDPEGDGTTISSLGIHEHWNSAARKQYSRNLASGEGIELWAPGLVNNVPRINIQIENTDISYHDTPVLVTDDVSSHFVDPDGDNLTFTVASNVGDVLPEISNNELTLSVNNSYLGIATITLTANDGTDQNSQTFAIEFYEGNRAPDVELNTPDVTYNSSGSEFVVVDDVSTLFSDPDGDVLTFSVTSDDVAVTPLIDGDQLKISSDNGFEGTALITLTASDGELDVSQEFIFKINPPGLVEAKEALIKPIIDGNPDDRCWKYAQWLPLDNIWLPWGTSMTIGDFEGRFKVSWDSSKVYYLFEIIDDVLVHNNPDPLNRYYHYDIVEIFLDEDKSGGDHALNYNAFAYHVSWEHDVADLDEQPGYVGILLNDHIDVATVEKDGKYYWELAVSVYDDSFNATGMHTPVKLSEGKSMGMAAAYCDSDNPDNPERENFIGSIYLDEANQNSCWENASLFGTLTLVKADENHSPVAQNVNDTTINENGTFIYPGNITTIFNDIDGDKMTFGATSSNALVVITIDEDGDIVINTDEMFDGEAIITLSATDGITETEIVFNVNYETGVGLDGFNRESIKIYPNPAQNHVTIANLNNGAVTVFDVTGKKYHCPDANVSISALNRTINISTLENGVYFIRIERENEIINLPLVISK